MPYDKVNSYENQTPEVSKHPSYKICREVNRGKLEDLENKDVSTYLLLKTQRNLLWDGKEMHVPNIKRARTAAGRKLIKESNNEPYERDAYIMRGIASCSMRGIYHEDPKDSYVKLSIDKKGTIKWSGEQRCNSRYCVKCEAIERKKRAERLECVLQQAYSVDNADIFFVTATQQTSHKTACIVAIREAQKAIVNQLRKWNRRTGVDVGYFGAQETLFSRLPNAKDDYGRPIGLHTYHSHLHFIMIVPRGNEHYHDALLGDDGLVRKWFIRAAENHGAKILHPKTQKPIAGKFQWRVDHCDGDKAVTKYITKHVLPVQEITRGDKKNISVNRGLKELLTDIYNHNNKADRALYRNWIKTVKGKNLFRETKSILDAYEQKWRDRVQENRVHHASKILENFDFSITKEDLRPALSPDYDDVAMGVRKKGNREQEIEHLHNLFDEGSLDDKLDAFLDGSPVYHFASDVIRMVVEDRPLIEQQEQKEGPVVVMSLSIPTPFYNYLMSSGLMGATLRILRQDARNGYDSIFTHDFRKLCEKIEPDRGSAWFVEGGRFDLHYRSLLPRKKLKIRPSEAFSHRVE